MLVFFSFLFLFCFLLLYFSCNQSYFINCVLFNHPYYALECQVKVPHYDLSMD